MNALAHCMLEPVEFARVVQYSSIYSSMDTFIYITHAMLLCWEYILHWIVG